MASEKMIIPGPIELAKEAWEIYRKKFWSVAGVFLKSMLYGLGYIFLASLLGFILFRVFSDRWNIFSMTLFGLYGLAVLVGLFLLGAWIQVAYIVVIRDWKKESGVKAAFDNAKAYVIPFLLTSFLAGFLIMGGTFFLLLPGLTFGLWFSFAQYVVICEKKKGFSALHTSREFYRNTFWGVWWRQIAIRIPEFVVGFLIGILVGQKVISPEIQGLYQFISLLLIPFYFSYTFVLYEKLIAKRPAVDTVSQRNKNWYILLAVLGYILAIAMGIVVFSSARQSFPKIASLLDQYNPNSISSQGIQPATAIVYGLISYHAVHGEYPASLSQLVDEKLLASVPLHKNTGLSYRYSLNASRQDFKLCTPKTLKPEKCISSNARSFDL